MAEYQLTRYYKDWDLYQQRLVCAVAPLSAEPFALCCSPHTWSIGMIAAHIVAARVWWFYIRAGEGSASLAPLEYWDEAGQPVRSATELVSGLEMTWQMIQDALVGWASADLEQVFPVRSDDPTERTRQWIIWHVLEHDLHHGGELSSILGAHGLPAIALE